MYIEERESKEQHEVIILPLLESDLKYVTQTRFRDFIWTDELRDKDTEENKVKKMQVVKLIREDREFSILGLMSMRNETEGGNRVEIILLQASHDNEGKDKKYERIIGSLIAYAGLEALKTFGVYACVYLTPKTAIKDHYMKKYRMLLGKDMVKNQDILYLDGKNLLYILNTYDT